VYEQYILGVKEVGAQCTEAARSRKAKIVERRAATIRGILHFKTRYSPEVGQVKTLAVSQAVGAITRAVIACMDCFYPSAHLHSGDIGWAVAPMALPRGYECLPRKYDCGVVPSIVRNISMKALTLS